MALCLLIISFAYHLTFGLTICCKAAAMLVYNHFSLVLFKINKVEYRLLCSSIGRQSETSAYEILEDFQFL